MDEESILLDHDITFQQIQSFLVIAKYRSLSKAAKELYISQPALSKTLRRFEEGIGIPLFVRSNQGVTLTPAGKGLYLAFKSLYDNLEQTIRWIKTSTAVQRFLHIAVPMNYDFSEDFSFLRTAIEKFKQKYPDVAIMESLFDLKKLSQALEFGGVDIMFIPSYVADNIPLIKHRHASEFELCVVVSAGSPLVDLSSPDALEKELVFAMPTMDSATDMECVRRLCCGIGFNPRKIEFPPNSQTLLHAVRLGRGIGVCWRFEYPGSDTDIRYLPIPHEISDLYIDVAWNPSELTQEARRFINMLP